MAVAAQLLEGTILMIPHPPHPSLTHPFIQSVITSMLLGIVSNQASQTVMTLRKNSPSSYSHGAYLEGCFFF